MKPESRIKLDGWLNNVYTVYNDKFVIAVNASYGSIYLINVEDKKSPYILSKLKNYGEEYLCICIYDDYSYGFVGSSKGFRILPLKS